MKYINYYSKARNRIGMSNEEFDKELAKNNNKIVTKVVPDETHMRINQQALVAASALESKIFDFIAQHPEVERASYGYDFKNMYETFKIPKRKGGFREICAPKEDLKKLQRELAKLFTRKMKFLAHNAAHGFTRNRNCKTSLEVHRAKQARWFLKLDIKDFFPNTTYAQIKDAMNTVYPFCCLTETQKHLFSCLCTFGGVTPQGAPTSPVITNLVMVANDVAITKYCREHYLTYTRYADDILISSRVSFDWETVQKDISEMLGDYTIKTEKTRYGSFNGRNWNLGLMFNNQYDITVGHKKKKLVKNLVHNYITKSEGDYYYLIGLVGYCNFIEPDYFGNILNELKLHKPA